MYPLALERKPDLDHTAKHRLTVAHFLGLKPSNALRRQVFKIKPRWNFRQLDRFVPGSKLFQAVRRPSRLDDDLTILHININHLASFQIEHDNKVTRNWQSD